MKDIVQMSTELVLNKSRVLATRRTSPPHNLNKNLDTISPNAVNHKSNYLRLQKLHQRSYSSILLKPNINICNYHSHYLNQCNSIQNFIVELNKLLALRRFYVITSSIFPLIYKINYMMKRVFMIMKSSTHQFEEIRKALSTHTIDQVNTANLKITETFSLFYESAEELNKIYNSKLHNKIVLFFEKYDNFVNDLETRISIIENRSPSESISEINN